MANNLVLSVQKAFNILDIMVFEDNNKEGLRLNELSKKTGIKTNTLHNLLKTMIAQNYIQQYENGNYAVGIKIERICILSQLNQEQAKYGPLEVLESLRDELEENITFAVLSSGIWKNAKQLSYESAIQVNYEKVGPTSIYEKATGRILASYCSTSELEEIITIHGLPNEKWDDIKVLKQFLAVRQAITAKGFYDMYTQNDQLWAIGIPAFNHAGNLIGSIGLAAPAYRCDELKKDQIRKRFMEIAEEIKNHMY